MSGDHIGALSELVGIVMDGGVRYPSHEDRIAFRRSTLTGHELMGVVENGTGRRAEVDRFVEWQNGSGWRAFRRRGM
jgi:hypothetical protein